MDELPALEIARKDFYANFNCQAERIVTIQSPQGFQKVKTQQIVGIVVHFTYPVTRENPTVFSYQELADIYKAVNQVIPLTFPKEKFGGERTLGSSLMSIIFMRDLPEGGSHLKIDLKDGTPVIEKKDVN